MLMIRGRVDEWRVLRMNTYLIHCSLIEDKNRVSMTDALPLPFDSEIREMEVITEQQDVEKAMADYQNALQYFNDADPLKIKK